MYVLVNCYKCYEVICMLIFKLECDVLLIQILFNLINLILLLYKDILVNGIITHLIY